MRMRRYTEVRNDKKAIPLRSATMGIDMPSWSINELGNNQYLTGDAATRLFDLEDILCAPDGTERIALDRLREICQAEREGKLVVLPCKVGDTVYRIISYKCNAVCNKLNACNSFIYKACKQAGFYVCPGTFQLNDMWWIGKTIFLTREEAEAALKGEGE